MADEADLDDARRRYHFALAPEDLDRLPFYAALLARLEADEAALRLLASVRVEQRNPMLVLAALHRAALLGHPVLGPLYDAIHRGAPIDVGAAADAVVEVVRDEPEVVRTQLWRSTQTNEPGRSAVLQAVVRDLVSPHETLAVVDVGTSAGINLYFDQFPVRARDDGDPLTLVCEDEGEVDRATPLPSVGVRVGIDPYPLDLGDDEDRLWLKACLWPEERRRHERFDAIVARYRTWPVTTLLKGDALDRLDDALELAAGCELRVVMNTWSAIYFTEPERRAYYEALRELGASSNVAWVSIESTLVAWPDLEEATDERRRGASQVVTSRPGEVPVRWGWCHPHGRWVERLSRA
ncbi:MAG TPA: DUF2332 domain-containing protein [Acidimicrobiales bacterium]|nr:DUF2332 domain-containing protein [Acidimicrobiales bacterium]